MQSDDPGDRKVNTQLEALIRALLSDRPVAYHAMVAKAVGSATAGLLLSQFLYWTPRTTDPDGWFYKTQADITDETALTRWEQENARARLKSLGVVQEKRRGVPGKIYFRVNFLGLQELLLGHNAENPHSTMRENHIVGATAPAPHNVVSPQSGKPAIHNAENPLSITETTPENTFHSKAPAHPVMESQLVPPSKFRMGSQSGFSEHSQAEPAAPAAAPTDAAHRPARSSGAGRAITGIADRMDRVYQALQRAGIEAQRAPLTTSETQDSNQVSGNEPPPAEHEDADPEYIDTIMRDLSGELHDTKHLRANVTQARRLWQASGMSVLDFKDTLYDVRRVVRLQPGVENKMAYYFKCLKVVLGIERNPHSPPVGHQQGREPSQAAMSSQPTERKSLAGRYAHLVKR